MFLEKLCNSTAPSGYEGDTRNLIKSELEGMKLNYSVDRIGNIVVHKENKKDKSSKKVMLSAHMDEIGLIITSYNSDGTLKFSVLGNVDRASLYCKVVLIGKNKIKGVIGLKPIHLQTKGERTKAVPLDNLSIDIGANSEKEAREIVSLGEFAVFDINYEQLPNNIIKAKALNDRLGCCALLEVLREDYNLDLYVSFNVQENVGKRGSIVSIYNIKPDVFIMVDTVCTDDTIDKGEKLNNIALGKGPIIPYKFGKTLFDKDTVSYIRSKAQKDSIAYQNIACIKDKNELLSLNSISLSYKLGCILIPCRYMNSIVSVCSLDDYENTIKLLHSYLRSF